MPVPKDPMMRDWLHRRFWPRYLSLVPYRLLLLAMEAIKGAQEAGNLHNPGYSKNIVERYKAFSGVAGFHGRVAEVGPGSRTDVAELILSHGADSVDQVDRFHGATGNVKIRRYTASAEKFFLCHTGYDFILSNAVLEHLYDPIAALGAMIAALNPGGAMVHIVDLRDHGIFSPQLHELSFLRLGRVLYSPLQLRGGPNRVRVADYKRCLESHHVESTIHTTTLVGSSGEFWHTPAKIPQDAMAFAQSEARRIRPRLAGRFRSEDVEDLAVTGIAIVARLKL